MRGDWGSLGRATGQNRPPRKPKEPRQLIAFLWLQEQLVSLKSVGISCRHTGCKSLLRIRSRKVGAQDGTMVSTREGDVLEFRPL